MQALLYPAFDELTLTEQPRPIAEEGEVLLRVAACGICGSELESFKNRSSRRTPPLVMGHEYCGRIESLGPGVRGFAVGEPVIGNALVSCGECVRCLRGDTHLCAKRQIFGMHRLGAFAEFVNVPARVLLQWPEQLPAAAASLAEPLGNGVHMVRRTEHLRPETVLVIGAGPIGLLAQQAFAVLTGAKIFSADLKPARREAARRLGASDVFDPVERDLVTAVREGTGGEGVDLVVDAVGSAFTKRQSLAAARAGGAAVWIGLHENEMRLDSFDVTLPEKQVFGTYAATLSDMEEAVRLMENGDIRTQEWVQTFPLDDGVNAFRRMLAGEDQDIKAVLIPADSGHSS